MPNGKAPSADEVFGYTPQYIRKYTDSVTLNFGSENKEGKFFNEKLKASFRLYSNDYVEKFKAGKDHLSLLAIGALITKAFVDEPTPHEFSLKDGDRVTIPNCFVSIFTSIGGIREYLTNGWQKEGQTDRRKGKGKDKKHRRKSRGTDRKIISETTKNITFRHCENELEVPDGLDYFMKTMWLIAASSGNIEPSFSSNTKYLGTFDVNSGIVWAEESFSTQSSNSNSNESNQGKSQDDVRKDDNYGMEGVEQDDDSDDGCDDKVENGVKEGDEDDDYDMEGIEQDDDGDDGCDNQVENGVNEGDEDCKTVEKERNILANNDNKEKKKEAARQNSLKCRKRKAYTAWEELNCRKYKKEKGDNNTGNEETIADFSEEARFVLDSQTGYWWEEKSSEAESKISFSDGTYTIHIVIDVPLNDRKFVHTLVRAQQSDHKPEVTVRNIYSNAVELNLRYKDKAEDMVLQSVISKKTIDVIGDRLVRLGDANSKERFREYITPLCLSSKRFYSKYESKTYMAVERCPCCDFCVINDSQKEKFPWQHCYRHLEASVGVSPDKNVCNVYDDENTDLDHHVLWTFFGKVFKPFSEGTFYLVPYHKVEDKLNCINSETMKKIEEKVLLTKVNAVQQYPIPIQCAGIYKYGSIVCSQAFQNYIHFIDGVCQQQIISDALKGFKDQKIYIRELMREHLSKSLANIYTGGMGQQYNAIPGEASLDKDVKYYFILHSEIIGHE